MVWLTQSVHALNKCLYCNIFVKKIDWIWKIVICSFYNPQLIHFNLFWLAGFCLWCEIYWLLTLSGQIYLHITEYIHLYSWPKKNNSSKILSLTVNVFQFFKARYQIKNLFQSSDFFCNHNCRQWKAIEKKDWRVKKCRIYLSLIIFFMEMNASHWAVNVYRNLCRQWSKLYLKAH